MAEFHFVEDYERHVARLLEQHSEDEAMSLAVGGSYAEFGVIEADILVYAGLKSWNVCDRHRLRKRAACKRFESARLRH